MSKKMLAVKLHDSFCPKCNGQSHSFCEFVHSPIDESVWDNNYANKYFLKLAEKATNIMYETEITEDMFLCYAKKVVSGEDIPDLVQSSMDKHSWIFNH